jgi:hypothetical protein
MILRDRQHERAVLDGLLQGARAGHGGVLVVRGEAGIGKTALLDYAIESAPDLRMLRAVGVESEAELAFAALHQLCVPLLDRLDWLPGPQRDALQITFGLSAGPPPDRFFVALAVLWLLSEAAQKRPLLCMVDDAQWLDRASAQALAFLARRLVAEPVVMVFATREPGAELEGLPELAVEGLPVRAARELLRSVIPGRLDMQVADQIVAETGGNPLALLELPRGLSRAQLAAGFGWVGAASLSNRIEETFRQRLAVLPENTQGRGGRSERRSGVGGPRGGATRDRRPGARAGGIGRFDQNRRPGPVSPSAGALGGVPGGDTGSTSAGTQGAR